MQFDILITPATRDLPTEMLRAAYTGSGATGVDARIMRHYDPRPGAVLMLYGLGAPDRLPVAREHRARGGHFVALDAGYWERKSKERKFRVTVDDFHCPGLIMRGADPGSERLNQSRIEMSNHFNAAGNIVLVGNGMKSSAVGAAGWAARKSREVRRAHPNRRLVYRPKRQFVEPSVVRDVVSKDEKIEMALDGASLVVCRHSNVAVDACRMGIPVVCDDGAAAAIYPSRLEDEYRQPTWATRAEFLRRLAWWQWSMAEMESGVSFWPWLTGVLSEIR